ncbi:HK97 gp10 family phage protein [Flavobacterium algicola]|uniref:HK97 gp10 family phage protein n=1 Tax=Flavobacterium algicola TaxID=556529 RepID=UPI001EFC662B|nr:HK97 gp10 family phage protein [Flavobacterium algicola]MCG9792485.1 hypothetical protein [Flavobacterium algicola]
MSNSYVQITGFEELKEKVKLLANDKDKKKEVLLILRQVAKPTVRAIKTATPVSKKSHVARGKRISSGNLQKSIGTITSKSSNPTILVGPRAKNGNDGWYGHMVNSGHNIYRNSGNSSKTLKSGRKKSVLARVTNKRTGNKVNRVEGVNFQEKGYEQTKGNVTADAEQQFAKFIQRRINKLST